MDPDGSALDKQVPSAVYRRGRLLVGIVVAGSAAFWLRDALRTLSWFSAHGESSILGGGVVLGLLCWSALRGGRIGGGFFIVVYASLFLQGLTRRINELSEWLFPVASGVRFHMDFTGPGQVFNAALSSVAANAWVVFCLWVLLFSNTARQYRQMRRQQIAVKEASAFEWPPAQRS